MRSPSPTIAGRPRRSARIALLAGGACILLFGASAADKTGVGLEKISLPSGPGSIEGLGDAFEPQLNSGTSSYSVKIAAPPGVAGLQPDVVLRYNSGGGNGHFGIAWSDGILSIQRQVEKGLPRYGDSDRFTLNGEELVPLTDGSYRVENESAFRRITRDGTGWIVTSKNGTRHFLGSKPLSETPSRIVRPGTGETFADTFKWCIDDVIDVHGNRMQYRYQRFADSPGDTYCTEIRYSIFGNNYHAIAFDFEERADPVDSSISGFQILTSRRCHRIRVTSQHKLVRRYELSYTLPSNDPVEVIAPNDAGLNFSNLRQVTQYDNTTASNNYLPPLRLGYTRLDVSQVTRGTLSSNPLISLGNPNLTLTDINADALPDLYYTDPNTGTHSVWYNKGLGRFSTETTFLSTPTGFTLDNPGAQLVDFDGDARIDLVQKSGGTTLGNFVYFPNTTQPAGHDESNPSWGTEQSFTGPFPPFDLDDPSVRTLDLDNDKRIDFMRTTAAGFIYYYNRGDSWEEDGLYLFGEPQMGDITFADALTFESGGAPNTLVKLADMNGDRLLDLVKLTPFGPRLELEFWPNRGLGKWGNRTTMSGTVDIDVIPVEDVFTRDVNGDGLADIVSVAYDHLSFWINLGDNSFSQRYEVADTPEYIRGTTVLTQADINGNGSTDFLWENFSPATGSYRIDYVDLTGTTKPNLLKVIDNGIGLQTHIEYRTSTDYYVAAMDGSNPWTTRLPFPSWCVSKLTKSFGLDLDALPGDDTYVTEFAYHDGYYDPFEKEFRGFAFAKKVERGDDRPLPPGTPRPEINSPSTLTRLAFHTGLPDNIDNDGDNRVDEFDPIAGYEEEALKGKVLWTETCLLDASFDGIDNDRDGFTDESDEGTPDGQLADDAIVFTREHQTWDLKTIHDQDGGFTQPGASLPFATADSRNVTFPFSSYVAKEIIEAQDTLHADNPFATGTTAVLTESDTQVDFFGNPTVQRDHGITAGGSLGTYDDERFTHTTYVHNLAAWIVGLPVETRVTDEDGNFVSKSRHYYDNRPFGQIGTRALMTSEESFIGTSTIPFPNQSPHPGDPRVAADASLTSTTLYDAYGNPTTVRDPNYTGPGSGHERVYAYDPTFHTYVETETIKVGNGSADLVASATYDTGGGVILSSTDFNANVTTYGYDGFFRLVNIVKPGNTTAAPTQVFEYLPGDTVRSLNYVYTPAGNLTLSLQPDALTVSRVIVRSRETAGGGTFDIVQITDGAGHKLGTIEEGETPSQFVYKDVKRYTSRGHERDSYLPFFAGNPTFRAPPPDGDRVTCFMDALGRKVSCLNPPETTGGPRAASRTDYLPLLTVLFDEEDNDPASQHANTPHLQFQDGLDRLVGVDEINEIGAVTGTFQTRYRYDLNDNLIHITDSQQNQKWMRYDGLKRMLFMHDPDRGVMTYTYDAASNLIATLDAKDQEIRMAYDGANRILSEDYLDANDLTPDVAYHYDTPTTVPVGDGTEATSAQVKGKLSSVTDLSGAEHLSYDSRGRTTWKIKRVQHPLYDYLSNYRTGFEYDSLDRLTRLIYADNDWVDHTYNSRNLPETIIGGPSGHIISAIDYIASGQMQYITYGNGVQTGYTYDPRLRLRTLDTANDTEQLIAYSYQFDTASNITQIDDNRPLAQVSANDPRRNTQQFTYDDLYRLTSVHYPSIAGGINYTYDRIGNMLSKTSSIDHLDGNGLSVTDLGTMTYGGTAGPSNRTGRDQNQPGPHALTAVSNGNRTYPHDPNGNMTDIDGLQCTWDFKDRLIKVENDKMVAHYTYDYTDRRITKKVIAKPVLTSFQPTQPTTTLYPDRNYEVRPNSEHVKFVWNGETRVVRVSGQLNTTSRIQRIPLSPGWNVNTLAVDLDDASIQVTGNEVAFVVWIDPVTHAYHSIHENQPLVSGTQMRIFATAYSELTLVGPSSRLNESMELARAQWIGNSHTTPIVLLLSNQSEPVETLDYQPEAGVWSALPPDENWQRARAQSTPIPPGGSAFAVPRKVPTSITIDAPPTLRYYHPDHLTSSQFVTDGDGTTVSFESSFPFGHPRNKDDRRAKQPYGFTQKEHDAENGLHYFEARYLSSNLCRFTRPDPLAPILPPGRPQLANLYAYCSSRPVVSYDPTGCAETTESSSTVTISARVVCGNDDYASIGLGVSHTTGTEEITSVAMDGIILGKDYTLAEFSYDWNAKEDPLSGKFNEFKGDASKQRGKREKTTAKLETSVSTSKEGIKFKEKASYSVKTRRAKIGLLAGKVKGSGSCEVSGTLSHDMELKALKMSCEGSISGEVKVTIPIASTLNACRLEVGVEGSHSFSMERDFTPLLQKEPIPQSSKLP